MKRIRGRHKSLVKRLYWQKEINKDEMIKHKNLRFSFFQNRNPDNLNYKYPKLDSVNYEEKTPLFTSLQDYLIKRFGEKAIYTTGYNISLSIDKQRQKEINTLCRLMNRKYDYDNKDLNFLPIKSNGLFIGVAQLFEPNQERVKTLMENLNKNEHLEKIYKAKQIPWKKIVLKSRKVPTIENEKNKNKIVLVLINDIKRFKDFV